MDIYITISKNLFNDNKKVFARTLDVFHDEHPLDTETFEFRKKE